MNERVVFRFLENGNQLPIDQLVSVDLDRGGVVMNGETSAWPRSVRFGLEGVAGFKDILNELRHQTANGTHRFSVAIENDALAFTTELPNRIPIGTYHYALRIADLDIRNGDDRLIIEELGNQVEIDIEVRPEKRRVQLVETIQTDRPIADLVNGASRLDGKRIIDWLRDDGPRPKRKACLLNLLAKLRTTPTEQDRLVDFVQDIFFADVDRIFAKVNLRLLERLEALDQAPGSRFREDHGPIHPGHAKMLRRIPPEDQDSTEEYRKNIRSFREDAQPSLQITVASIPNEPARGVYADIDIDLGNPSRDLAGFFIHLGELIDEGKTNHLKLNKKLRKDPIVSGHLHYSIG